MKLSTVQLSAFATGIDHVEALKSGVRLHRMPAPLEKIYQNSEVHSLRVQCTTCVRIRFASNSRWIKVKLNLGEPVRWYFTSVIGIDNERQDAFGPVSQQKTWEGTAFSQDKPEQHIFDIWLPHMCRADLLGIEVEDGCAIEAAPPLGFKWLVYGDSITQGATATLPVLSWVSRVAHALNANAINYGVGGATLQKELAQTVPDTHADLVTVSYGVNDWICGISAKELGVNAAAFLDVLKSRFTADRIVITTPTPFFKATGPNAGGATLDDLRAVLEKVAGEMGVRAISGTDLLPADHGYFNDLVHPNDSGHALYAQNVLAGLRALNVRIR